MQGVCNIPYVLFVKRKSQLEMVFCRITNYKSSTFIKNAGKLCHTQNFDFEKMDKTELLKEYGDTGNKIKPRSFVSFYDYNRTTCGWLKYIFGADIHTYRRIVWIIVFCTGFIYSVCKESSRVIR